MSNTYYTSLSGMLAASYGLQNTSNNISNMQSPGFKRTDVFYSSLGNSNSDLLGAGVQVSGSKTNFNEGNYLGTQNPTDLAIIGAGFFVIKLKNNQYVYTRSGQFNFNNEGVLVDQRSGGEVQGYDSAGNLVPIHQLGPKIAAGKATHELRLQGDFVLYEKSEEEKKQPGPLKNKYQNVAFEVKQVFDSKGISHILRLEFESTPVIVSPDSSDIPDDGKSWDLIGVTCDGVPINFNPQQIIFSGVDSTATNDNCSIQLTLTGNQNINLNFGTYTANDDESVTLKRSTQNPEGTKIQIGANDGYGQGKQISCSFDSNGQIIYNYDNNQHINGIHVGLAHFDNVEHALTPLHDSLFMANEHSTMRLGRANQNGLGSIQAKQLESSNVDSTMEFAQIVVLQRMFQACSQIMNIDKQLLEELAGKS